MTGNTTRDLAANAAPADTNLVVSWLPTVDTQPTKTTIAELRTRLLEHVSIPDITALVGAVDRAADKLLVYDASAGAYRSALPTALTKGTLLSDLADGTAGRLFGTDGAGAAIEIVLGTNLSFSGATLNAAGGGGGGDVNWGGIGGTLSAQTDLQAALDLKLAATAVANVTNHAQLKRDAADFATFDEKVTPISADLILIEDSAAAGAKKKVQIGNLPGNGASTFAALTDQPGDNAALAAALDAKATTAALDAHIGAGGAEHAGATTDTAGFMSPEDKTALDGLELPLGPNAIEHRDSEVTTPTTGTASLTPHESALAIYRFTQTLTGNLTVTITGSAANKRLPATIIWAGGNAGHKFIVAGLGIEDAGEFTTTGWVIHAYADGSAWKSLGVHRLSDQTIEGGAGDTFTVDVRATDYSATPLNIATVAGNTHLYFTGAFNNKVSITDSIGANRRWVLTRDAGTLTVTPVAGVTLNGKAHDDPAPVVVSGTAYLERVTTTDFRIRGDTNETTTAVADHDADSHEIQNAVLAGATLGDTLDAQGKAIVGNITGVVSATGALTSIGHSNRAVVTTGNVTIPNAAGDVGFFCLLISGGAHTITFNSTTSAALEAGDLVTALVQTTTVVRLRKSPVADQLALT